MAYSIQQAQTDKQRLCTKGFVLDAVQRLLQSYTEKRNPLRAPLDLRFLARLRSARVEAAPASLKSEGKLLPVKGGFLILYREDLHPHRRNLTICHEIAHTFFYENVEVHPARILPHSPKEEKLCFFAAEHLLVPSALLRELTAAYSSLEPLPLLKGLARQFEAAAWVVAKRITSEPTTAPQMVVTFWDMRDFRATLFPESVPLSDSTTTIKKISKKTAISASLKPLLPPYRRDRLEELVFPLVCKVAADHAPRKCEVQLQTRKIGINFAVEAEKLYGSHQVVVSVCHSNGPQS